MGGKGRGDVGWAIEALRSSQSSSTDNCRKVRISTGSCHMTFRKDMKMHYIY